MLHNLLFEQRREIRQFGDLTRRTAPARKNLLTFIGRYQRHSGNFLLRVINNRGQQDLILRSQSLNRQLIEQVQAAS